MASERHKPKGEADSSDAPPRDGVARSSAELNPADLPAVLGEPGVPWWSGALGVVALVVAGIVMTTVMQSSTAAITVTIAALYAGAINLDQALALVIGQNIGTSTSSAMAAIGASSTAKRLAVAYVAFKVIAAGGPPSCRCHAYPGS